MTDLENYLTEYYHATQALRRLSVELITATKTYENNVSLYPGHDFNAIRTKNKKILKPVEEAVELMEKIYDKEKQRIDIKITENDAKIREITALVDAAGLTGREYEYVRLRYWEGKQVEATGRAMGYEHTQLGEIRKAALEKIEEVKK